MNRFGHGQTPARSTNKKAKPGFYPNQLLRHDPVQEGAAMLTREPKRFNSTHEDLAMLELNDGAYVTYTAYAALRDALAQMTTKEQELRYELHHLSIQLINRDERLADAQAREARLRQALQSLINVINDALPEYRSGEIIVAAARAAQQAVGHNIS